MLSSVISGSRLGTRQHRPTVVQHQLRTLQTSLGRRSERMRLPQTRYHGRKDRRRKMGVRRTT